MHTFWLKLKKVVCSVSFFLRHIEPKRCWPIRLQDSKSNISLEQSNEIVYFIICWCQKLRVDRKILGGCAQKLLWPHWSQGKWMNEWMSWADFSCWCKFRKVKGIVKSAEPCKCDILLFQGYSDTLRIIPSLK